MTKKESKRTLAQLTERTLDNQNVLREQPSLKVNRRHMLKGAGMFLGASGTLAALATPAGASSEDEDADDIAGLWQGIVSAQDNSFPPFKTFEQYGGGLLLRRRQTGFYDCARRRQPGATLH